MNDFILEKHFEKICSNLVENGIILKEICELLKKKEEKEVISNKDKRVKERLK